MRMLCIEHVNLSVSRNVGVRNTTGEIIAYVDGDAIPQPTWLAHLATPFLAGADFAGGRIDLLNAESWIARFLHRTRYRQFFGPRLFSGQFVGCNMAFRRAIFDTLVGFHENFVSLGDESTLHTRMHGRYTYSPAADAVVHHEHPDTISAYLRAEWRSATLSHLAAKVAERKVCWKSALLVLEQFLITLFSILLCLVWFAPRPLGFPLAIAGLAVIRRLYLRPLNRAIAKGLIRDYGILRGTVGHVFFCFAHNTLSFLGWLISPWMHRNVRSIPPMTTPLTVLRTIDSKSDKMLPL